MGCWLMDLYQPRVIAFLIPLNGCVWKQVLSTPPTFSSLLLFHDCTFPLFKNCDEKTPQRKDWKQGHTTQGKTRKQRHNTILNQPTLLGFTKSSTNVQCVNFNSLVDPKIRHSSGHYLALTVPQGNSASTPALQQAAKDSIPNPPYTSILFNCNSNNNKKTKTLTPYNLKQVRTYCRIRIGT